MESYSAVLFFFRFLGGIDRLQQQRRANAVSATLSAYVGSLTQTDYYYYYIVIIISIIMQRLTRSM